MAGELPTMLAFDHSKNSHLSPVLTFMLEPESIHCVGTKCALFTFTAGATELSKS